MSFGQDTWSDRQDRRSRWGEQRSLWPEGTPGRPRGTSRASGRTWIQQDNSGCGHYSTRPLRRGSSRSPRWSAGSRWSLLDSCSYRLDTSRTPRQRSLVSCERVCSPAWPRSPLPERHTGSDSGHTGSPRGSNDAGLHSTRRWAFDSSPRSGQGADSRLSRLDTQTPGLDTSLPSHGPEGMCSRRRRSPHSFSRLGRGRLRRRPGGPGGPAPPAETL